MNVLDDGKVHYLSVSLSCSRFLYCNVHTMETRGTTTVVDARITMIILCAIHFRTLTQQGDTLVGMRRAPLPQKVSTHSSDMENIIIQKNKRIGSRGTQGGSQLYHLSTIVYCVVVMQSNRTFHTTECVWIQRIHRQGQSPHCGCIRAMHSTDMSMGGYSNNRGGCRK
jgi:hypothetical protein